MEYQLKKEQILSSVQYTNLLSFSLVQNKLERNFKSIVQALLLNQTKADDILSKTDQMENRFSASAIKTAQDLDAVKQTLKLFNDRITKLEASETKMPKIGTTTQGRSSFKTVKEQKRQEAPRSIVDLIQPTTLERSSFYDKKFDDFEQQISLIKQRMPTLQFMESELENMKRDFTGLKGELITFANKSNKNIKRESINVQNARRDSTPKIGKNSFLAHSNSSVTLENKQNKAIFQTRDQNLKNQTNNDKDETDYEKQIEGLHFQVNTLNICYEQLKVLVEDLRKKDIKSHSLLSQIEDKQKRMKDQMRRDSENFQKQLKNMQLNILNLPSQPEKSSQPEQKGVNSGKSTPNHYADENTINFKNQLNDKLSKLQNSLQGFVTQSQFSRFKGQSRDKLQELQKKHEKLVNEFEQEMKKIYDMFINKDLDITRLGELINSTSQVIKQNNAQADRKHNIAIARIQEIKKGLQNLREDVEFYQSMNTEKEKKANENEKTQKSEGKDSQLAHKEKFIDTKAIEDLRRYSNNKLHDQRAYLVGLVRDLQKKQNAANSVNQQIANIWQKVNEFNVFLGKKADAEDIKKNLVYLQKKINRLGAHLVKAEDNTEDARIAKTNWFCLSCDKNLLGYQGKIGRHVVWDQMPTKGVVKATIQKKGLPSLKNK